MHPCYGMLCVISRLSGNISLLQKGGTLCTVSVDNHLLVYCGVRNLRHLDIVRQSVSFVSINSYDSHNGKDGGGARVFRFSHSVPAAVFKESCYKGRAAIGKLLQSATLCSPQFLAVYREWP